MALHGSGSQDLTDTIDGGKGIDTYDVNDAVAEVDLDFTLKLAFGIDVTNGFQDNVTGFENAIGGSGGDSFFGNGAANRFEGRDGSDTLGGLGGNDVLLGGIGIDELSAGQARTR